MITYNEDIEQYHQNPAVSHSKLRDFADKGPRYYFLRHVLQQIPAPDSDAFRVGRAFEDYLLNRPAFDSSVTVRPEGIDGRTKEGKAWLASHTGLVITDADFQGFKHMAAAVAEHSTASGMIAASKQQPTIRGELFGVPCQARPDMVNIEGRYTLDLKTTITLDDLATGRGIARYGYHHQAAMADLMLEQEGLTGFTHYLLAVEKAMPNRALVLELSPAFIAKGRQWVELRLREMGDHRAADFWPLTTIDTMVVEPPVWM